MLLANILIVDDERVIREVLSERLTEVGHRCTVAPNAFDALKAVGEQSFDLVLCDIDMPGKDGISLLQDIKGEHPEMDVVMVTGVVDTDTAIRAIRLGASDYLTKPFNLEEVVITVDRLLDKQRLVRENREYQVGLEQKVQERTRQLEDAYRVTLEALVAALDIRDTETQDHSIRVARFTYMLAEKMGVTEPAISQMRWGALLHDIGKIGMADAVLNKPGALTDHEFAILRDHPTIGAQILSPLSSFAPYILATKHHHERFDGRGYPDGLSGSDLPLSVWIIAIADAFDAMTSTRPYRKGKPISFAIQQLEMGMGTQFHPECAQAFIEVLREKEMAPASSS